MLESLENRRLFAAGVPDFRKVVVVVEENRGYSDIVGSSSAPYINSLAAGGALFTNSYAVTHPSLPNYLALFSGSTQGVTDDDVDYNFSAPNLDTQLKSAGKTFRGFAEPTSLRRHDPWWSFSNAVADGRSLSNFPSDFNQLPDISFVVPNNADNMHDGTIRQGDDWLKAHLGGYAAWAKANNSLLVVTWDEDDGGSSNHIATLAYGANVRPGRYARHLDHYQLLATLEAAKNLPLLGRANTPVTDIWGAVQPQITSIQWMTGAAVTRTLTDGATLYPGDSPRGIRATLSAPVGSVKFILTGPTSVTATDSTPAYDLFQTTSDGGSGGRFWKSGSYTLSVQLFTAAAAGGSPIGQRTLHFTVA